MEEVAELLVETQTGVLLIPTPSLLGVGATTIVRGVMGGTNGRGILETLP